MVGSTQRRFLSVSGVVGIAVVIGTTFLLFGLLGPAHGNVLPFFFVLPVALVAAWFGMLPALVVAAVGPILEWARVSNSGSVPNGLLSWIIYGAATTSVAFLGSALRKSRRRHEPDGFVRATLSSITDAVITTDARGRIAFLNPVAEQLTGWTRDAAIGKRIEQVVRLSDDSSTKPPTDLSAPVSSARDPSSELMESFLLDRTGTKYWIQHQTSSVLGPGGRLAGAVLVFRDITEQRKAEGQSRFLASIVESSTDAIATKSLNGIVTSWNQAAERLFGYTAAEMIGQPISILIPPDHENEEPEILDRIRRDERVEHYETIRRRKNGTLVPISLTVSPIHDASGRVVGASKIVRDITERRRLQEQVRDRVAELAEFNRRKDEFLATLAHELRNPLMPIANAVEIMRLASDDPEKMASARLVIERQHQLLKRLVDDLLDVARITRGRIQLQKHWVDLGKMLDASIETVGPFVASCGHDLRISRPEEPLRVFIDPVRVSQVVTNLLHNAAKYSPNPGIIRLSVERQGEEAVIRVEDYGMGISAPALRTLFDTFGPGSPHEGVRDGLGIGLILIKALVQMHGGSVRATSAGAGLGSQFEVRLPIDREPVREAPALQNPGAKGPSRRILVVDDNRDIADTLSALLRLLGHEVAIAGDGGSALRVAQSFEPHVILLDVGLPDMSGYEVARRLRGDPRASRALLVAVTGWGQEEDRRRARNAGFDHHLTKPTTIEDLAHVLEQKAPLGP